MTRKPYPTRMLVTGIVLSLAGFSISANTLPPLVTGLAKRYSVSPALFGIAFFFQYLSFASSAFLSGYIPKSSRAKPEVVLVFAMVAAAAVLPFVGVMPSFPFFILFMAVIGGCGGLVESSGTYILAQRDTSTQGKYLHTSQLFYCLGAMAAPMVIGILQTRHVSGMMIGFAVGTLMLMVALVVCLLVSCALRSRISDTIKAASSPVVPAGTDSGDSLEASPPLKTFVWFFLVMVLYMMIEISVGSWLPAHLEQSARMPPSSASMHLTLFWTGLAAARFLYIFIRTGSIKMQLALHVTGILASIVFLFLLSASPFVRALMIFFLGGFCGPVWPLIVNLYSKRYSGKRYVMYLVGAGSIGALLGIFVTSAILEYRGADFLMAVLGVYGCLLVAAYAILMRDGGRVPSASA